MTEVIYDQHFLINEEIITKTIKNANITSNNNIIEIGPGKGVLTNAILKQNPNFLTSIEIDESFKPILEEIKKNNPNFDYILGNGLENLKECDKLIANIPYAITEPLYKKILELQIPTVNLLHGRRFYNIINDETSKWNKYVNAFYDVELIEEVTGENFEPKAKITSVLVKLALKTNLSKNDLLIQNLFKKEARSVKNAIKYTIVDTLNISKKEINIDLDENLLNKKLKDLSREEFNFVFEYLSKLAF